MNTLGLHTHTLTGITATPIRTVPYYDSISGKHPLPGKDPRTTFQGVKVAASSQTQ